MANILITGGCGFIGSTMAKALAKTNHNLYLIDNMSYGYKDNLIDDDKKITRKINNCFVEMDVNDISKLDFEADVILHFAGISSLPECESYPAKCWDSNLKGTQSVIEYAKKYNSHIIFASTSAVYEQTPCDSRGHNEDDSINLPILNYAMSKYFCEQMLISAKTKFNINSTIFRFFNVYGPHQDFKRLNPPFTSLLVKNIIENKPFNLFNFDDDIRRDYIYVDDVIKIILNRINTNLNYDKCVKTFNLTSGKRYSTLEIINILEKISGKELNIVGCNPYKFWSKYEQLKNLNKNVIKNEVFKQAIGDNHKLYNSGFFPKIEFFNHDEKFTDMYDGLKIIYEYQLKNSLDNSLQNKEKVV